MLQKKYDETKNYYQKYTLMGYSSFLEVIG